MGGSFEQLMQEVLLQQQLKEDLEVENRELRQRIAELRRGHTILLEILGQQFTLAGELLDIPHSVSPGELPPRLEQDQPTQGALPAIAETPQPDTEQMRRLDSPIQDYESALPPSALEEMFGNEFGIETIDSAVWARPEKKPQQKDINEHEKAALRRELSGSFLLE